jgi:hypothetical protein
MMNYMKHVSRMGKILVVALFVLTGASCRDEGDEMDVPVALVSLYHGSPDAPDLDIEVDDRDINFYPFEFADYTGYLRFYTGERNLKFGPYAASNIAIDTTVTFERNNAYSVLVVDEYENAGIVVLLDNSATPAEGKAKVRVIHISPDAPPLDFAEGDSPTTLLDNLSFREASDFMEVDAREYDFQVRTSSSSEVVLTLPDINLQPRYYYTVIIRGYATPPGGNPNVLSAQIVVN